MPITNSNWESFFQGSFAEHHVCSLFYFFGYEAQKVSPDFGVDLLVTNVARARFRSEEPLIAEIQVKSALLDRSGAFVSMAAGEVDFLSHTDHRYCIFVLLSNFRGRCDPESYERGDDPDASNAIDRDMMTYWENLALTEGRALRRRGVMSIYDFNEADVRLFWLHSSQIKRLRDEGRLKDMGSGKVRFEIELKESSISVGGLFLIPELYDLIYIVSPCKASRRIRQGHMSIDDY